jgi:glycosyltransferase involved in cell wall biosynthesis
MTDSEVLVVTHPLAPASENHVSALLDILSAITSVALVTANLSAESLIRDQHEVIEISNSGAGDTILTAAIRFIRNQFRMCRVIARRDEDIVLFFGATSYLLPIAFARIVGRTVVLEPRGDVPLTLRLQWEKRVPDVVARVLAGLVRTLERIGYWLADGIVTYTPAMAEQLDLDRYEHKLYPYGARYVDTDVFQPRVPFTERDPIIGFLGRLDEEKGVRELAEVAKRLPDGLTFRLIGDGNLADWLASELEAEIEVGSVELIGWVDHEDVPEELSELQLLVMPSHPTEGLPTVILESLACGTPVYATPVSGVPDVVREGETGFLMAEMQSGSIVPRVETIAGREDLASISDNGQQLIEEEYSFEAAIQRYREILSKL